MILTGTFGLFAFLYTDPGTGTLLLQLLAAGFLGVAFYFRYFTKRVKGFFDKRKGDAGTDYASNPASEAQHPTASSDLSKKIK
jgi:hypothetical protein